MTDWVLRCHSREARGRQHTSLTTDYACGLDCTNMGGNIPVMVCYSCALSTMLLVTLCCMYSATGHLVQRFTPKKLAMSMRHHTKVLANGEG